MASRYFTLDEANRAVAELRPVVEQMVEHRRRFLDAQERRGALTEQAGSNGGDLTPGDFAEVEKELEEEATTLAVCIERIQSEGAQIKDLDDGLLDFPSLREGEEILLCWRLGEDEIALLARTGGGLRGPETALARRRSGRGLEPADRGLRRDRWAQSSSRSSWTCGWPSASLRRAR